MRQGRVTLPCKSLRGVRASNTRDEASQTLKEAESEIAKEPTATPGAFPKSPAKGKKPLQSTSSKDDPSSSSSSESRNDKGDKMFASGTT